MTTNSTNKLLLYFAVTLVVLIGLLSTYTPDYLSKLQENYSPSVLRDMYDKSQYTVPNSKNPISDAAFYLFAGNEYIHGSNPILINAEHPPTGKYIVGLVTLLTGHMKTFGILFACATYLLVTSVIFRRTRSVIAILIFTFLYATDTNIRYQVFGGPLLDIVQLFFLIAFTVSIDFTLTSKNLILRILLSGISLGLLASSKMYFPILLIMFAYALQNLIQDRKKAKQVIVILAAISFLGVLIYTASYAVYFAVYHGTPLGFIKSQLYTIHYWTDNAVNQVKIFGAFIPLVFLNRYYVWWGNKPVMPYEDWTLMWPISFVLILFSIVYAIVSAKPNMAKLRPTGNIYLMIRLSILVTVLCVYFLNIPISPRYLILLFVPGYMLTAFVADEITSKIQVFHS